MPSRSAAPPGRFPEHRTARSATRLSSSAGSQSPVTPLGMHRAARNNSATCCVPLPWGVPDQRDAWAVRHGIGCGTGAQDLHPGRARWPERWASRSGASGTTAAAAWTSCAAIQRSLPFAQTHAIMARPASPSCPVAAPRVGHPSGALRTPSLPSRKSGDQPGISSSVPDARGRPDQVILARASRRERFGSTAHAESSA